MWSLLLAIGAVIVVPQARALPQTDLATALEQLHSTTWSVREIGVETIVRSPSFLEDANVRQQLVQLLGRENQLTDEIVKLGTAEQYGEGFGEYYAELLGAVFKIANLHDPQILRLLADGSYNSDSQFALDLADAGGVILVPIALELLANENHLKRWNAIGLLARLYEERVTNKIAPANAATIKQRILEAAAERDPSVRLEAVRAIGRIGSRDDLPLLNHIATSDPQSTSDARGKRRFPVREQATKATDAIRKQQP